MHDKDLDKKDLDKDLDRDDDDNVEVETVELEAGEPLSSLGGATPVDLVRLGLSEIAYIRRAMVNDVPMWTIHSAAGDPLGAAHSFDQAWAAVKQNDMEPVRVH